MFLFLGNEKEKRDDFYSPRYESHINFSPINTVEINSKSNKDLISQVDKKMDELIKRFGKPNNRKHSKEKYQKEIYDNNHIISNVLQNDEIVKTKNINEKLDLFPNKKIYIPEELSNEKNLKTDVKYITEYNRKFR